jgi:hypothetical protein
MEAAACRSASEAASHPVAAISIAAARPSGVNVSHCANASR